jgi:hypothetical protein
MSDRDERLAQAQRSWEFNFAQAQRPEVSAEQHAEFLANCAGYRQVIAALVRECTS